MNIILNRMHKTRLHIIRLFALLLLLAGGVNNEVYAKVKYHILTLPFSVAHWNGDGNIWSDIRVEALLCESNETTIGLPDQFKSPLINPDGFRYWGSAASTYASLYDAHAGTKIIDVKYNIIQCSAGNPYQNLSNELTAGADVGSYTDIYVTYEYNSAENNILDLSGATAYNVGFTNGVEKFMVYNRSRNNRVANANSAGLSGEDLASDDFVVPQDGTAANQLGWKYSKWGPIGLFAGFKFEGNDPYNITILTSYSGDQLHITDKISNVDGGGTIKPYAGSSLMAKIGAGSLWFDASNNKHYKILSGCSSEKDWTDAKYKECHDLYWYSKSESERAEPWVGFYRYESPTLNTFALLPNNKGGYMFVGSKLNQNNKQQQPSGGNYYSYFDNYDTESTGKRSQPYFKLQSLSSAYPTNFYEIKTYTVHIKTHGAADGTPKNLSTTMKWSDARLSENPAEHFPEALKRKYCSYTAYSDPDCTVPANTFQAIQAANNGMNIYLKYTVSMPFETLPSGGNYQNARWYTMRMDGVANPKYIAYKKDDSNDFIVTNGSGAAKGSNTASQVHQGENSAEAMVAFLGDPYELKILNRKACEAAPPGNRYIGCASASGDGTGLSTNMTGTSDISTWEIVYESTGVTGILLRQFNTASTPKYIGLGEAANNKPVIYSKTESRIKVEELEEVTYTYHIVRNNAGDIAVKASDTHDVGKMLRSWTDIPEIIRSPFLNDRTVVYYGSLPDAKAETSPITNAPYENRDIYVRYSVSVSGSTYNVRLNNDYIYTDATDIIKNKPLLDDGDKDEGAFQWTLNYNDPYHMTIWNVGKEKYVNFESFNDNTSITWSSTPSYFVAKSGAIAGTYEVMAATGDGTDASTTYYNIGRPSANTVKLYSNSSYISGNAVLRFQLIGTDAKRVTYHLIDKKGKDLLQAITRQTSTDDSSFPPEYHSPLVSTYHYYVESDFTYNSTTETYTLKPSATEHAKVGDYTKIYVTYDVNNLVDLKAGQLYLLKYEAGEEFYQEDGGDGRSTSKQKAIYPYVNGDGNFFIYGQEQYDIQQEGASSTRTRWAWYVESNVEGAPKGDPYHVTIKSRQTESYPITNSSEYNAYFMTYKPTDYSQVITTLGWPGMNSETATEYMVLGSEGQYQLVTTNTIPVDLNGDKDTDDDGENVRYVVNSFEQYWKTYDTIRRKLLNQPQNATYPDIDNDIITVPSTPCVVTGFDNNRTYLTTSTDAVKPGMGFHSYEKWAYAKRWNGYNNGYSSEEGKHETKKGWEKIEHWYQTVKMGEGYFDFVKTDINPVLILLDQHGWEIMRKPIPTDPDDPDKDAKFAAIRPYNSPMVKEYAFWATGKKRTGFHQYYLLSDRIGGDTYTSTDLTNLPPYDSKNVHDKKGNLNDQYVTYIVKDEYAQTYNPSDKSAKPFLIEQGTNHKYATTNAGGTTLTASAIPQGGDMKAHILKDDISDTEKWYIKPNVRIDFEMGYDYYAHTWTKKKDDGTWDNKNPNAYEHKKYKDILVAQYISDKDSLGYFSFSNGFDPYNIQISSVSATTQFMKTNANGATLHEGSLVGSYPADIGTIVMGDTTTLITPKPKWYDSRNLDVTNATFMAVQDAAGNMQLMPRFDHSTRMAEFGTLIAPTSSSSEVAKTYTKLYRPEKYEYLIIDNDGNESLRYKTGGDLTPQIPAHFQSPLATNFKYYKNLTLTDGVYTEVKNKSNISAKEITTSLDGAKLTDNKVYVRYEYDEESDDMNMLKGNWLTMQLNNLNVYYNSGLYAGINSYSLTATDVPDLESQSAELALVGDFYFTIGNSGPYTYKKVNVTVAYNGTTGATYTTTNDTGDYADKWATSKPLTVDADAKKWQWKFAEDSQPDPYAIYIYNRNAKGQKLVEGSRFALLSHSAGDYALAKTGLGTAADYDYTYKFLNGNGMNTTTAASVAVESGFTPTSGTFVGTKSQVKLANDVTHTFTYKVYTNEGVEAISATQSQEDVISNDWKPVLPETARTPLLNKDQYRYYEQSLAGVVDDDGENYANFNALSYLFGLYDDIVYTHYTAYDPDVSTYVVPNVRNATGSTVAKGVGSNEAPIGLDGKRPYNIIWHADNMMKSYGTSITSVANQELQAVAAYEWEFEGDDPYAIKIKSVGESGKYIHEKDDDITSTELSATATPFMLLNKDGHDYGVFAKTGDATTMLSGCGDALTTSNPTEFIPFALSTYKVIYHLMIKNIGSERGIIIPFRENKDIPYEPDHPEKILTRIKSGTTLRDLTTDNNVEGSIPGDYYQLGASLKAIDGLDHTTAGALGKRDSIYCADGGHVSLGDAFEVPQAFYRPNVSYDFYIEGVYNHATGEAADETMNAEYKGLKMTNLGVNSELLGKIVFVNIVYNFMGGLDTNSGSDFVEGVSQNKWYTFETSDATPRLAEYSGTLKTVPGYATHYTNDYLWTPVGDPYGFKMYNRYLHKNIGGTAKVMSTVNRTSGTDIEMVNDDTTKPYLPVNSVYELLATSSTTPGYFRIHPVANMKDVTQVYMKNNSSTGAMTLNTVPTDWTFGLSEDVMNPYYQAAGYIGGLNSAGKAAYDVEAAKTNPLERLMGLQDVVYNHDNNPGKENYIVHYTPGYYRLHSQPGSSGITTPRYASGYTHLIESTSTDYDNDPTKDADGDGNPAVDILPMHFYEVEEYDVNNPTFRDLGTAGTDYTETPATRGDIPLVTVDEDPASIFYFSEGSAASPTSKISTQGLYVKDNKMTSTSGEATSFTIVDIGAGIVALQNGVNFLKYAQTPKKYELKFDNTASTVESARWCMKPVQKGAKAGDGEMPLKVTTNNGGDEYYYTTFYAPFDVLLTGVNDVAYIIPTGKWPTMTTDKTQYVLYPKEIGEYNAEPYAGNNKFIPAGTPVIIRTKNTSGEVTMVLPTVTPSSSIATALSGEYLEQMLTQNSNDLVFVLGRSYTHSDQFSYDRATGVVTPAGLETDKGVGFYKNANTNRESSATKTMWTRNNKYVYGNKVYYYYSSFAFPPARQNDLYDEESPTFVPVIFDYEEEEGKELEPDGRKVEIEGDGCMYDLLGRKVATREQVEDGSWRYRVAPGVYIVNGKKIRR